MPLTMPANDAVNYGLCPEGNHVAICHQVIDLGTQVVKYERATKKQRKIYLGWVLPEELREDGEPFELGKRYTFSSMENATLRKHLESWRNKRFADSDFGEGGFQIRNVLCVPCMLSVVHSSGERTYANVQSVSSLPKQLPKPEMPVPPVYFSLHPDEMSHTTFDLLSSRMQDVIAKSPEYQGLVTPTDNQSTDRAAQTQYQQPSDDDTDIPF